MLLRRQEPGKRSALGPGLLPSQENRYYWFAALLTAIFAALAIYTAPSHIPPYAAIARAWQPSEAWLYDRDGRLIDSERVDFRARRLAWTPLDRISPALVETVLAAEDRRFREHHGIDWLALAEAAKQQLTGGRSRGASTISMQVAAFLDPELARPGARGWRDKLRQMRAAWALESAWSKPQILTAYLNLAPFRGEAQGVGAAALTLFGKGAEALNRQDALLLTALLPDPAAKPEAVAARACRMRGMFPSRTNLSGDSEIATNNNAASHCDGLRLAAATMLSGARAAMLDPGLAPHLAQRVLDAPGKRVATTLDSRVQAMAAQALRRQLQGLGPSRARDGAVVVVDNRSGEVLAYVGGVGLGSTAASVDGANAYRQAGSTLKPFLYGQLFERGWLTAASILDDSPVQLDTASGLYVPKNYDHGFRGPVSARTALAGSLNVPAVRALLLNGVQSFRDRLWDVGFHGLSEDGDFYGFSLALGSAEVTLLELANGYRTLANGGMFAPLRITRADPAIAPRRILSAPAAWIVSDILADPSARSGTFGVDSALKLPFWAAAKTGTSKAMRDNWCVGYSDRYTVAVWVGNLEGDSMKSVSGTSGAAPVWRDIMLGLHTRSPSRAPPPPSGLERKRVAFQNGLEPARAEWFVSGTGQSAMAFAPASARRPRIVNPVGGSVYALDPDIPADRQMLSASIAGVVDGHRLILNRRDLGDAAGSPQLLARPGSHRLALVDPLGRVVDQVRFTVR